MNNAIKSIYKGTAFSLEGCGEDNKEIKELSKQLHHIFERLCACLPKEGVDLLEAFEEASVSLNALYNEEIFTEGFKLGVKLAAESLLT